MSVALLGLREWAVFIASAVKSGACDLGEAVGLVAAASNANCVAYRSQYREEVGAVDAMEALAMAREFLADESGQWEECHYGPMAYNTIDNDGREYLSSDRMEELDRIEKAVREWSNMRYAERKRLEQNAVAFDVVGQCPTMSADEINAACKAAGCDRVIFATFSVDESESNSDYWGGRQVRSVVIGFGKGKRESFAQLRKAAAKFKPTEAFGPGRDAYSVRVVFAANYATSGRYCHDGSVSRWHDDLHREFSTRAECEAYIASAPALDVVVCDGVECSFKWHIGCESLEHRECYSMGGGNYLGESRYAGWRVRSYDRATSAMEVCLPKV